MLQVPIESKVTEDPETVHTDRVEEEKVTVMAEVEDAEIKTGPWFSGVLVIAEKVII